MILCVGTTPTVQRTMVFERLELDEVNRAVEVHEYASGKSVNVARVLGVLGEEGLAVGFAGGRRGEFLLEEMTAAGIAHDFVRTAGQTRLCTTVIDRSTGQVTELVEEAPAASAGEWEELIARVDARVAGREGRRGDENAEAMKRAALAEAVKRAEAAEVVNGAGEAEAIVFSGTLAGGAPIDWPARWLGNGPATTAGSAHGPIVIVDARGEPMRRALRADGIRVIAKLNRQELAATLGEPLADERELRAAILGNAPRGGWLIVTMGKAGALASDGRALRRVIAPAVQAISPIGSGDSFAAGLAAGIVRGLAMEDSLKLACACGVANALTKHSGMGIKEDVDRLVTEVRVEG